METIAIAIFIKKQKPTGRDIHNSQKWINEWVVLSSKKVSMTELGSKRFPE